MNFNLNFRRRKAEPRPLESRIEYLGNIYTNANRSILTDIIPQRGSRIEAVGKFITASGYNTLSIFESATGNVFNGFVKWEGEGVFAASYATVPAPYAFKSYSDKMADGQWAKLKIDCYGSSQLDDGVEYTVAQQYVSTETNTAPLKIIVVNSNKAGEVYIKDFKVDEHHLVPWRIGDKGYLKDLTTGTIYGNGEGYILGPDVEEEVGE